ncbi:dynein, axonemal, heavy polypeptide 1 [Trypanosoma rangeli]|uniref:Dynein, axonemal, heavy polypeptide 1 n=1 Tax=Trypanosoma rangeli TaxID=5698 RepID=A0A3R7MN13_TRYRA|nr:dynein, axonemal, heavy polypeptide 1 [Trypanosoma rangeli]RNF08530.1 dynein, axonemal, heavy polypeptide 1 [Trypanosoma rangeli]|eukprot:RNF08530.1 dynein, axonemal, heavy polypeptide 1 [Trypanosoma rangeli]
MLTKKKSDPDFLGSLKQIANKSDNPLQSHLDVKVQLELNRTSSPRQLYRFQKPESFTYEPRRTHLSASKRIKKKSDAMVQSHIREFVSFDGNYHRNSVATALSLWDSRLEQRDSEILRMIQKAVRPPAKKSFTQVAPNDQSTIRGLQTDEDCIAFFAAHGSGSQVKYVYLERAPQVLDFRPYDLIVCTVKRGVEEREHYIMSATGVVHVRPGQPSEVVSLAQWMRESSLFDVIRRIHFFRTYLVYKAFLRWHKNSRAKQFLRTRKSLSREFLLSKATFSTPVVNILKSSYELTTYSPILYEAQGKHDYVIEEFRAQQLKQRQKSITVLGSCIDQIEADVTKLIEVMKRKADVPDLNTREALEQYLLANAVMSGSKSSRSQIKMKSMHDAREEQFKRMRELKRSIVEYSQIYEFVCLVDCIASETVYRTTLSSIQSLFNTLRNQDNQELRSIGFQVLLQATQTELLFNPAEKSIRAVCLEIIAGCIEVANSTVRLCNQKHLKGYFSKTPRVWNMGHMLSSDARMLFLQESILQLVGHDYAQANTKMQTYLITLPHIHFLQREWSSILAEWENETEEKPLSAISLAKLYLKLQEAHDALRVLMASFVGHMLWVNAAKLRTEIEPRMRVIREGIDVTLRSITRDAIAALHVYFKQKSQLLNERPSQLQEFAEYVANYKAIVHEAPETETKLAQADALCELMDRQQVEFLEDEDKQLKERTLGSSSSASMSLRIAFDDARLQAEAFIEENLPFHTQTLEVTVASVEDECIGIKQIISGDEFVVLTDNIEPIIQYLKDIKLKLDKLEESERQLTHYAKLFDTSAIDWSCLYEMVNLLNIRYETWTLFDNFLSSREQWFTCPLKELDTHAIEDQVNAMVRQSVALNRQILEKEYEDEVTPHLLLELQALRGSIQVIHDCGNKHMTPAHWNIVLKEATGIDNRYHEGLNLQTLQEYNILDHKDILAEQSGFATGEWKIVNDLDKIKAVWDVIPFETMPYKNRERAFILAQLEDVIQQLDDHQIELQTIMASRFVAPVRERVEDWIRNLRHVDDVIEEWITLQKNWMYLEFIFSSDDIKAQLPEESDQFTAVDELFRMLTMRAATTKNVYQICTDTGVLEQIKKSNEAIDHIQKRLEDYLETKRVVFPRFYFLSNDELLSILSDVRNPKAVQPHLSKCFDSIAALVFNDEECSEIVGMLSGEKEEVNFEKTVYPVGNVEQWLCQIESTMKDSLLMHMRKTVEAYPQRVREEWFFEHPAQCIQAVDMVVWTGEVEEAINMASLGSYYASYQQQILRTVELVKQSLTKLQRMLVCTLIVLNVHSRDIVQTLHESNVTSLGDFAWTQQLRYYWEATNNVNSGMSVAIRHCGAHLWYGYEYLGNQPRLVITPLTDRAFLTCTSALSMNLGAAPQGPAGTGKTESVKDLGKALARQVVVFNCSDGINYKTMSRMFAGLAQAGAWACFDEFNRIELEVLSVVAQQMLDITTALAQNLHHMYFDGHPIKLSKNFGVFVTMNPGYAGRTELPDNLKALFRPICMMIPDYALIAEIMFYSEGFADARTLARKMVQLYKLSSEQLSKQDHYDFGMRAVKSILVLAGGLKRQHPTESEDMLLIRAMRDANVPKFLREDTVLFMALIKDLFPTIKIEESEYDLLKHYVKQEMEKEGLQVVEGLVTKTLQLYDTLVVRHGVMLVGQTYSGKTTIMRTLQGALTQLKLDGHDPEGATPLFNRVHIHLLNPKSVTMGELYGQVNDITREWTDGIISNIARGITRDAQHSADRQWIVFDGPVDAIWIENMNTVLDDNKLLCLFSGERIKLPSTATFMFEVQDLAVASPATVSRCGMVFSEPYYVDGGRGWIPIVKSLIAQKAALFPMFRAERVTDLLNQLLPMTLDFIRKECREWIVSVDAQLAVSCVELLAAFIRTLDDESLLPSALRSPNAQETDADEDVLLQPEKKSVSHVALLVSEPEEFRPPTITDKTVPTNDETLFDMYFLMSFVWSVGGNLSDDSRERFNRFVKKQFVALLPDKMSMDDNLSVYDYVVHKPSMQFVTWRHLVPSFFFSADLPYFELIVPTVETVSITTFLGVLAASSRHVLLNGITGTGKSLSMLNFVSNVLRGDDPSSKWEYFTTVLSAQSRAHDIEDRLEGKLYKIRSNVLGPSSGKRVVFVIDDLNMPALEKYGASPPLELLRQLITQGGFYDKRKSPAVFKEVHDIIYLAACGVPGGGRNEMTKRLVSRFHLLCQPVFSDHSIRRIFGCILHGFLSEWEDAGVRNLSRDLVDVIKQCYDRISREKLPTPKRSHYTFNLRDFSKVVQGTMQVSPRSAPTREAVLRAFVHEVSRVFHDRLIDDTDRQWWWGALGEVMHGVFQMPWDPALESVLFGDYMRRDRSIYEEVVPGDALQEVLADYQKNYEMESNKSVKLVFFKDAIHHISRMCRIFRQPRGHALLVGMGGTGRQSLCRLAAFISDLPVYGVSITRTFSMTEFRDRMKEILLASGCKNQPVLFFLSDSQIMWEEMLEDVNNLLNTGEVPGLMQNEDVDQIVETVRPFATAAGKKETRNVIFSYFVSLCRNNVHVVLAMSPVGEPFRRRLRMFPSLVNCCTIDWFDQWPADALSSVASRMFTTLALEEDVKGRLIQLCVAIHMDVQKRSEEFFEELRRHNYTTPSSYLELLTCYQRLLGEQSEQITGQAKRYQGGVDKLQSTQLLVDEMKKQLVQMQPKLLQAAKDTEEIMEKVKKEQGVAQIVRAECAKEEELAMGIRREADGIRAECQAELDKALPILKAAEDALAELRPDDIREVKSFQKPAARVVLVLEAVLVLLGEKDLSWDRAKLVMSRMDFIKDLQNYKRDELTERVVRALQRYINNPEFQPEEVAKSSKACKSLSMWVLAINNYYGVVKVVTPKRARLAEAEAKLNVANNALREAQERLKGIENEIDALKRTMQENIERKEQLEKDIELTMVRLDRAEQLMSGLSREQDRWRSAIEFLLGELKGLPGKVALAAGFVAYLGPFTAPYRTRMVQNWWEKCKELEVPISSSTFDLTSMVTPLQVQHWANKGLPQDPVSIQNGVITHKSKRWCLCIDPQGQAAHWVRAMERDNNLRVIKLTDATYMRVLENAIRMGLPVLLENVEETVDAALDSVLLCQTYRSQGRLLLKLGDTEIDYDPAFRLYMTSKLANPHYLPELQIKVTVINFTVTQGGLENQLLADVVRYEYAELETRAIKTVMSIANGRNQLKEIEDRILTLLASSTGNILDNEPLVTTLKEAQETSEAVTTSLEISERTQKDIEVARNRYRPVATRGAIIYTVISQLAGLDHMYQISLDFFKQLFVQTLQRTEKADTVEERVALLLPAMTLNFYSTVCRGLFEKDKLIFVVMMFVHIFRHEGLVRDAEWEFLLKGSEGRLLVDADTDIWPLWMNEAAWNELTALSRALPEEFAEIKDTVYDNEAEWSSWFASDKAYEWFPESIASLTPFQKLLVLKTCREDLTSHGLSIICAHYLGKAFTESPAFDLEGCFADSTPTAPIIFVLTPGSDPTVLFTEFADRKGFGGKKLTLSLGQDQGPKAEAMIQQASVEGLWVYLQNCHVYESWMPSLERCLEELQASITVHTDFRLWLTTMPARSFPVLLLQSGVKLVKEPPKGLKANIRDSFSIEVTPTLWDSRPANPTPWRRLLCSLTYFHAVIQERRKFGPLGWNIPYEWNRSDFSASLHSLSEYIPQDAETQMPWSALRYMIGIINYGGRVTDFLDTRSLVNILQAYFNEDVVTPGQFNITADGVYCIPAELESIDAIKEYLGNLPPFESPELFGLHANADIIYNRATVRTQLASMLSVQPRTKGTLGRSPEEKVMDMVNEFERLLPPLIDKTLASPDTYQITEDGTMISLGTVVSQEIDFFNVIVEKVQRTLLELKRGIKGEVVMSLELEGMFDACLLGQVPQLWHEGGYLSRKPLASWFQDTLQRVEFFRDWNDNGRPMSFWLSGFFFPQGFLTGVLQAHSREHKIPIDDICFRTNVTRYELVDDIVTTPTSGVLIHGLFLEGARFDLARMMLDESRPRELYTHMPVIHLEPVRLKEHVLTGSTLECPVYKTCARAGALSTTGLSTNFVVLLDLNAGAATPEHWVRRGVALLCMLDD